MTSSAFGALRNEFADKVERLKYLVHEECPECGSPTLIVDGELGEIVCANCGFVVASKLEDRGKEWRAFTLEERQKRARTGAPVTYTIHDKGLSTKIDWRDRDAHGHNLPQGRRAEMYRLRKWQRRIRVFDSKERNLASAMSVASKIGDQLSLPRNVLEESSVVYRRILKKQGMRGRRMEAVAVAALYIACRRHGLSRKLKDFAEVSRLDEKVLARAYRFLVKELDLYLPPVKSNRYVSKFSNELEIRGRVEALAHRIIQVAKRLKLTSGKAPSGTAAAAIYMASIIVGDCLTQREVAGVAGVSEVTVRNRYKDIRRHTQLIVDL